MSESSVGEVFDKLFYNCTKRIVVATFASNVHRVQQIVNAAIANKRKIAVCGRSMINMIETAVKLGYIKMEKNVNLFFNRTSIYYFSCINKWSFFLHFYTRNSSAIYFKNRICNIFVFYNIIQLWFSTQ